MSKRAEHSHAARISSGPTSGRHVLHAVAEDDVGVAVRAPEDAHQRASVRHDDPHRLVEVGLEQQTAGGLHAEHAGEWNGPRRSSILPSRLSRCSWGGKNGVAVQ